MYAYWYNETDETDTDEDGIKDELEKLLGLDPYSEDTDNDGLPDNMETDISMMDSTKFDTDEDGIPDGQEDFDEDGLINTEEIALGTDFCNNDTDGDVLSDGEEYLVYGTEPLNSDTDEDGVNDYREISFGADPLVYDSVFDVVYSIDKDDYEEADIDFSVSLCSIDAEQADSLNVMPVINDTLFPTDMPGYMGCAYDLSMVGTFEEAVLTFEFDTDKYAEDVDPVVYYFDEEEQELIPLETVVSGNKAIAVTNHFSKYILVDRGMFDEHRELYDKWGVVYTNKLEIVFLSCETNSTNEVDVFERRKRDVFSLIDKLPDGTMIGESAFGSNGGSLPEFSDDKDEMKSYMFKYSHRLTDSCNINHNIYSVLEAIEKRNALSEKVLVVFYGGYAKDSDMKYEIVSKAKKLGVKIYCVGYGDEIDTLDDYMSYISGQTNGKKFNGNSETWVQRIAPELQIVKDYKTDTDKDGLPDFYEEYMPLFNGTVIKTDKNKPDTDWDGLLDGEEVEIKWESIGLDPTNAKFKIKVKLNSNPTMKDSDGDGLLDHDPIMRKGEVVVPPDNKPLDYNGPKGIWEAHITQMQYGNVATEYAASGSQAELNEILDGMKNQRVANKIRKNVKDVIDFSRDFVISTEEELAFIVEEYAEIIEDLLFTVRMKCTLFQTHIISATLCNFVQDNLGQAYHAIPETWQKSFGYTKLFDDAFRVGTSMNNGKIDFKYNDQKYALWLWKGDYWNLGTGAEVGLYKMSKETATENPNSAAAHYDAVDFLVPMQLSLYRLDFSNEPYDYYNWQPTEQQWWITGFVPEYRLENPKKMVLVSKIDFSYRKELLNEIEKGIGNNLSDYMM